MSAFHLRKIKNSFLGIGILFLSLACSKGGGGGHGAGGTSAQSVHYRDPSIALAEVSSDQCLNLEKYYQALLSLSPDIKARKITTSFQTSQAENHTDISHNFLLRLAAGSFEIQDSLVSQVPEFIKVEQAGCEKVTFKAEGHQDVYSIKAATKDSLTLENEFNGQMIIKWESPNNISFQHKYYVGNFLCDEKSLVLALLNSNVNWGGEEVATATVPTGIVNPDFLALVAEATGFPMETLFTTPPAAPVAPSSDSSGVRSGIEWASSENPRLVSNERVLSVDKLKELRAHPMKPELGACQ